LFNKLKVICVVGQNGDSLSGFVENENKTYSIDYNSGQIKVGDKIIKSQNGLIKEMGAIYMESPLFAEAFGIEMTFNYRSLCIILKSSFELPIIKQQRLEKMWNNIGKLKGEIKADTVLKRNYHLFKFGMIDWSLGAYQTWHGECENRFRLSVGSELFFGETDVSISYYDRQKFDNRQLQYIWRWVDNDKKIIKQALVGKIAPQTISFINSPVIGCVVRNSPTTVRKASGYYTINEFTEPNWYVELYINDIIVDYTKADASGLFIFKVPIVYGYTTLKLKFYGPMGEERTEERTMIVPYTIMPNKEFEYGLSLGILLDSSFSRFGRGDFNYGVNRFLTIGGGLEYLSSVPNGALIPFTKISIQPFSKLTFNGEYAYRVKSRVLLDYYFWKNALFELDYSKYKEGQLATNIYYLEERKVKLTVPFRFKKISGFAKSDYTQFVYKTFIYNQANFMFSAYYKQFSANLSTQLNWINYHSQNLISHLSLSYRINKGYIFRPSAQYNVSEKQFQSYKLAVEKSFPKGYIAVSYERNVMFDDNLISLVFKYEIPFARINLSALHTKSSDYLSESAQGSLALGSGNKYIYGSSNSSVGKGGISIYPFLDMNGNGIFDENEHMVKLTSIKMMGGKVVLNKKDSIIRIPELIAFNNYLIEFNDNDLENITWRFKKKTYQVLIDPNQFKRIDIPVVVVGEVIGMTYINKDNSLDGIGRILLKFYLKGNDKVVAEILSESDGYIDYLGLEPGEYTAKVDSTQLNNLGLSVNPPQIEFTIKASEEGDIMTGVDFLLNYKSKKVIPKTDSLPSIIALNEFKKIDSLRNNLKNNEIFQNDSVKNNVVNKELPKTILLPHISIYKEENICVWGECCIQNGYYSVQCGAFKNKNNAIKLAIFIKQNIDIPVGIVYINEFYKVHASCVPTKKEINGIKNKLEKWVYDNIFIVPNYGKKDVINFIQQNQNIIDSTTSLKNKLSINQNDENTLIWGDICSKPDHYYIQIGKFENKDNAMKTALILKQNNYSEVGIIFSNGIYKVLTGCFVTIAEADENKIKIMNEKTLNNMLIESIY